MQVVPSLAKLTAPSAAHVYPRTRLFERLDDALRGPVVWISAPAGSGKTTLVASYLAERAPKPFWYRLDAGDVDPAAFFSYLSLGLREFAPSAALPLLTAEYLPGLDAFARNFFRQLYACLPPGQVLVFDDYHDVSPAAPLHDIIREALAELPPGRHVLFISREDPPPRLARLRMAPGFTLIARDALLLTSEDAVGIARQRLGASGIGDEIIRRLHVRAQGWLAALVLMLEQTRGDGGALGAPDEIDSSLLFDYLATEIFGRMSPDMQWLLLKTALLPHTTAKSAEQLTGLAHAGELLEDLFRRNCLTTRQLGAGGAVVYTYHPLFRSFLLKQGRERMDADTLAASKRQAATVMAEQGDAETSVALLLELGAWRELVTQIVESAPELLRHGRYQTLRSWCDAIPVAERESHPWIDYYDGLARLPFDLADARAYLTRSYRRFKALGDFHGAYLAWADIVDSYIVALETFRPLDAWLTELDALQRLAPSFPSRDIQLRVVAGKFSILMYRRPDHPDLPGLIGQLEELLRRETDATRRLAAGHQLVLFHTWWSIDFAKVSELIDLLTSESGEEAVPTLIFWEAVRAAAHWMMADFDACRSAVERGLALADAHGVHQWDALLLSQQVWALITSGSTSELPAWLGRLRKAVRQGCSLEYAQYLVQAALEARLRDDVAAMRRHADEALEIAEQLGMPFAECFALGLMARVKFAEGDRAQGTAFFQRTVQLAYSIRAIMQIWAVLTAQAEFQLQAGDQVRARESLQALMSLGRTHNLVNAASWRDDAMALLCAKALEYGVEQDYVRRLIRRRQLEPAGPASLEAWPWRLRLYTLGRFDVVLDDAPLRFSGKAQKKPLELLKLLACYGGRRVPVAKLAELLWPDADGDAGYRAYVTTLQRLRKLLGGNELLVNREGLLSFDERYCWLDIWSLEQEGEDAVERRLALYQGPFLPDVDDGWVAPTRARLQRLFLTGVLGKGEALEKGGNFAEAIALYEDALPRAPTAETLYQQLMRCHVHIGQHGDALAVYQRCRQTLAATLGVAPSPQTEAIRLELAGPRRLLFRDGI